MALYLPENVNNNDCPDGDEPGHTCVHDWRIYWGNLPREITGEGG